MPFLSGRSTLDKSLFRYEIVDGYDHGGLLYFRFDGKEMVAVVRERPDFDQHRHDGTPLPSYVNTEVGPSAYGASLALEQLIPEKALPTPDQVQRYPKRDH